MLRIKSVCNIVKIVLPILHPMASEHSYPRIYLYKRLVDAKLFIDEHYAEKIDLDCIAARASFSKYHFQRLFKKTYGRTPHQYVTVLRIEKAKKLLHANQPIASVCYDLGFESLSSFTRLFKRYVGQTPSEFATQSRERHASIRFRPNDHYPNLFAELIGLKD